MKVTLSKAALKRMRDKNILCYTPKLSIDEIGEAMELRVKGVSWDNLAGVFGVHVKTLKKYIRHAEEYGFALWT